MFYKLLIGPIFDNHASVVFPSILNEMGTKSLLNVLPFSSGVFTLFSTTISLFLRSDSQLVTGGFFAIGEGRM